MAARPDILLQGRVPDVGATFRNALLNVQGVQGLRQARAQAEREAQLQPLRDRLLQAQATTAEQGVLTPQQLGSQRNQARLESVANAAQFLLPGLQAGDIEGTRSALQQRKQSLVQAAAQGQQVDTTEVDEALQLLDTNPQLLAQRMGQAIQAQQAIKARGGKTGLASAKTEFLPGGGSLQALPSGEIIAKDEQNRVVTGTARQDLLNRSKDFQLEIAQGKADIAVQRAGDVAAVQAGVKLETEPEIQARVKQASTQAGKKEVREQASIDRGITAADSTANIRRAISLLDTVKTGGIDAALVRARQIFGIEGADEGELSSNLGKAIISQLRETFGAAFTKSEGDKLDRIEAAFGKSPAANRRLLNNTLKTMERLANRGLNAAESREDDFAIQSIQDALVFELGEKPAQQGATQLTDDQIRQQLGL